MDVAFAAGASVASASFRFRESLEVTYAPIDFTPVSYTHLRAHET